VDIVPSGREPGPLYQQSVTDARDWFREQNGTYDLVVHLAAVVGGRKLIEGNPLAIAVDLAIDAECFQWCLRTRPGRLLYFSSSAAYPVSLQQRGWETNMRENDINLDAPELPDLTYGWSKLTGEQLARFARKQGLDVTVIRPFSGYGPDQALDYPFPSYIDRGARRADPFEVWGDGEQIRDFVHIKDVVALALAACERGIDGPVNAATGRATSFNDLARLVADRVGYEPQIKHLHAEPVGCFRRVGDPTLMNAIRPAEITLEEGIEEALFRA